MLDLRAATPRDVVDVLGTNSMNVTKNGKMAARRHTAEDDFQGNGTRKPLAREHHPETVEEMINGIRVPLTEGGFGVAATAPLIYAPWCLVSASLPSAAPTFAIDALVFSEEVGVVFFRVEALAGTRRDPYPWVQGLEPTWRPWRSGFRDLEVDVAKVDCVANRNLCGSEDPGVPTLGFQGRKTVWVGLPPGPDGAGSAF